MAQRCDCALTRTFSFGELRTDSCVTMKQLRMHNHVSQNLPVDLVLRHGYNPGKRRANRIQNFHLKHYFLWVRGLTTTFYIVYDYITSGHTDL
jgi:hypothetical protein